VSRARFLAEAEAEFLHEVAYYAERQPNGAIRFRQAVEAATARALAFPQAGPSYLVKTRRVFVRGYPDVDRLRAVKHAKQSDTSVEPDARGERARGSP